MDNVIANVKIDASELEKKMDEKLNSITKTHPRMFSIGVLHFNEMPVWSDVDVPVPVKNSILSAIEKAGFSVTYIDDDTISINAIKKQLQHDA